MQGAPSRILTLVAKDNPQTHLNWARLPPAELSLGFSAIWQWFVAADDDDDDVDKEAAMGSLESLLLVSDADELDILLQVVLDCLCECVSVSIDCSCVVLCCVV